MTPRRAPAAPVQSGKSGLCDGGNAEEETGSPPARPSRAARDSAVRHANHAASRVLRLPVAPRVLAATLGGSACFAAAVAAVSSSASQRWWGVWAAASYGVAAVAAIALRRYGGAVAAVTSLIGALVIPLASMPPDSLAQRDEVAVISRSAALLLSQGSPYESAAALAAAHSYTAYNPYLPALALFGLPRAIAGGGVLTDPRVWFGLVFITAFGAGIALAGRARAAWWMTLITASPLIAYPLATGGDDLPVLGLECLGLALLRETDDGPRPRPATAGLVLGLAAAMKATAWPGLAVALALAVHRYSGRATARFIAAAAAAAGVAIVPVALSAPRAMLVNTIAFPLGLAPVRSPAASVLPGHVIAIVWSGGRWVAIGLLATAGVCVLASLFVRPPTSPASAGARLALGLTLMFLLGPASRVGYIVYPLGLLVWLALTPGSRLRPGALAVLRPGSFTRATRAMPTEPGPAGPGLDRCRTPGAFRPPAQASGAGHGQPSTARRAHGARPHREPGPMARRGLALGSGHRPAARSSREGHPGGADRLPPTSAGRKRR